MDRVKRRIAAILAADVAGYSRLIGNDEELTLSTLKKYREIVDGLIAHHEGRIFGSAGDSVVAEFASAVEAVRCATEIQLAMDKRNADLPEPSHMRFRVGIHLGDVVADGDNLMGDGVNLAARLEALATPGGVCVSNAVRTQVRDRLSLDFWTLESTSLRTSPARSEFIRPLISEQLIELPFRGLDAFEFEHAGLFFGRAHALTICRERLEQLAASGKAFLLIYGMSGSGKSSLVRAGLLPAITRAGAVAGITLWRRCLFRPSEGDNAIAALAAALVRESALPELASVITGTELAQLIFGAPDQSLGVIRGALIQAAAPHGSAAQGRLVIAVDQMEELFTTEAKTANRDALVRALDMFAGSGLIWVIGTIRADFFHRCSEIPGFSELKDGLGSFELLPPTGPEIAQIIREPARSAGLRFEEDHDQGRLEDVLQDAAVADAGSLPLLEFVLEGLFQAGRERRLLTFAAYRALGGLAGAIARRADELVGVLPQDVQDALPSVLRALMTVRDDEAITARPALLSQVAGRSKQRALVDAMVAARLLVIDENASGDPVVRLAHEALLTRWPRAQAIANSNRDFLETRARVHADARRWLLDNKNPDLLLPAGKRLAESEELLQSRREEVEDQIVLYVEASLRAQQARLEKERQSERERIESEEAAKRERLEGEAERRRLAAEAATLLARRTRYAAAISLVLAILAGIGAIVGFYGQHEARRQTLLAEANANQARASEQNALNARNEALRNQSLSLVFLAQQATDAGDTETAILLALEALPKDFAAPDRPYVKEAEIVLYRALLAHSQTMVFRQDGGVTYAAFNSTGDRIVTSSYDKTARIWNSANGSEIAVLKGHEGVVEKATFSPDGGRIATAGRDGTARIWDAYSGQQLFVLPQPGHVHTATFNGDGTRILTGSDVSASTVWDAQTGIKIATTEDVGTTSVAFSPDGLSFASGDPQQRLVRIWRTEDGRPLASLSNYYWPDDVVYSPDGTKILAASWGTFSYGMAPQLWDVRSGSTIATLHGQLSDSHGGIFSHDGRYIATASIDGTARLWSAVSGKAHETLGQETAGLRLSTVQGVPSERDQKMNCAFSPDDKLLATASANNVVRVWDVETGTESAAIAGHTGLVEHVAFNPDGSRLLTASHDGTARLWDVDGVLTTTLRQRYPPAFAEFSPDGKRVVTGDAVPRIWDVATGHEIMRFGSITVADATFSPDGQTVATASPYGRIVLWQAETGRKIREFAYYGAPVVHLQFSPRGNLLASSSADGSVQLWSTSTGSEVAGLTHKGNLRKVLFSPDGKLVMTGLTDNTVRLWKTDGLEFKVLSGHAKRITAAAFSPDGSVVATSSLDGTVRIWSIKDGSILANLEGNGEPVTGLAFSPDGGSIVTFSRDHTARIWNIRDAAEKVVLRGHNGILNYAAFSPNGRLVVTASAEDRTTRFWDAESGREIAVLANQANATDNQPAIMLPAFSSDGSEISVATGGKKVKIVRVFRTREELITFARNSVRRGLTPCERKRFYLPVENQEGECPS